VVGYKKEVTFLKKSNQKTFAQGAPGLRADSVKPRVSPTRHEDPTIPGPKVFLVLFL
jgi:hypothetical protein